MKNELFVIADSTEIIGFPRMRREALQGAITGTTHIARYQYYGKHIKRGTIAFEYDGKTFTAYFRAHDGVCTKLVEVK